MAEENSESERRDYTLDLRMAFYVLGLITLVVTVLVFAAEILVPIVLAVLLWFLINAIANGLRNLPLLRQLLPSWLALAIASALTIGAMFWVGRLIVSNLQELAEGLRGFEAKLASAVAAIEAAIGFELDLDVQTILQDLRFQDFLGRILSALGTAASDLSLVLLFVLFLLLDQPHYDAKIRALAPDPERQKRVREVLAKLGSDTRLYIWIMTLVSVGVGLLTYAIAEYFGLKGAAFWGFLSFALNFIPTIGSFLGVIFPTLFALVQFDPETTLLFAALLGVVQFVMGNLVLPRVTGDQLNLSEFVVILSLTIWGAMWGVVGLFLAVPMMMVAVIVLAQFRTTRPLAILMSKTGKLSM